MLKLSCAGRSSAIGTFGSSFLWLLKSVFVTRGIPQPKKNTLPASPLRLIVKLSRFLRGDNQANSSRTDSVSSPGTTVDVFWAADGSGQVFKSWLCCRSKQTLRQAPHILINRSSGLVVRKTAETCIWVSEYAVICLRDSTRLLQDQDLICVGF